MFHNLPILADAASDAIKNGAGKACGDACGNNNLMLSLKNISNTLIFIAGALAVIILIVAGLRYIISNGDAKQVEGAKNTILYAVIGLIVAILAFAIVNFVLIKV